MAVISSCSTCTEPILADSIGGILGLKATCSGPGCFGIATGEPIATRVGWVEMFDVSGGDAGMGGV